MRGLASAVLVFEAMVVFFAALVAKDLGDVDGTVLWTGTAVVVLACVAVAALLRHAWAYAVGSVLQVAVVATGVVEPAMYFVGALFAGLWFLALVLGRRVARLQAEADRAARDG